jgi:hypothetical protein
MLAAFLMAQPISTRAVALRLAPGIVVTERMHRRPSSRTHQNS